MKPDHCHADHSVLVRDGITEARSSRRSDPHIAIAVVEDSPLSEMLGDAEDASHTQWHQRNTIERGWVDPEFAIRALRRACTNMLDMPHEAARTAGRRDGKECVSAGRSRWWAEH